MTIAKNSAGENSVIFDVVMSKEFPLDAEVYKNIAGLYQMDNNSRVEFNKNDDLLFMKRNGQVAAALKYLSNNTFEGGIGFPKVTFKLLKNGSSKAVVTTSSETFGGEKYLKYEL